jgi:putative endonuclease
MKTKKTNKSQKEKDWCVYILECLDGSYYTGVTNDVDARMKAHAEGKGSRYVLSKGFSHLLCSKSYPNKSEALKAEYYIKQLPKHEKLDFLERDETGV